jgi:hypothetical protein
MLLRCLSVVCVLLCAALASAQDEFGSNAIATDAQGGTIVADLEQQLMAGLKVRRDVEKAFVLKVVELVEQKVLPVSIVKSSFHWARRKNPKVPFPYFERSLRITADKIGVEIIVPAP